jgi:FAD/FMN-containing dehydrogenase
VIEERYLNDWSGTRYGTPVGVELPQSTGAVAQMLRTCNAHGRPVAVQGGRTGVSGGAAPGEGETILSLERLNQIEDFDRLGGIIVAGAGVLLEDLQRTVEAEGWFFPVDIGARGSCQIGGNVATNAGGSRVVKYGNVRDSVLGLEAVLADGSVLGPPNRLFKNNAGYSMASLMVGSEGTLGVVTRAAFRLVPLPPVRRTALLAVAPNVGVEELLFECRCRLREALSAFEVMWPDYVDEALRVGTAGRSLPGGFAGRRAVLLEVEGGNDVALGDELEQCLMELIEAGTLVDVVVSSSSRDAAALWAIRESVGEIQAGIRPYVGFDLGMSADAHDGFVGAAKELLAQRIPHAKSFFFGHAGDGNLHAVVGPCATPEHRECVEEALYSLMPPMVTSVTAEHGVGRKKKRYLARSRSADEIRAMKTLKRALDPNLILNPGRVLDM